jgi:hypothetical protein
MWISPQHLSRVLFSDQRSIDPLLAGSPRSRGVFDPKAAMAGFGLLRLLQSPRDALLARWEQQFRVCSTDRPNRAHCLRGSEPYVSTTSSYSYE